MRALVPFLTALTLTVCAAAARGRPSCSARTFLMKHMALLLAIGVMTLTTGSFAQRRQDGSGAPTPPAPLQPRRIALVSPEPLPMTGTERDVAISPDGTHVIYVSGAAGGSLMVRAIDRPEAMPLGGTTGAHSPFVSPDGRWVGFFTASELRKVPIA